MSDIDSDYVDTFDNRGQLYNDAMSSCPGARDVERMALIELLDLDGSERCCDAPAGGGYVADGIRSRLEELARLSDKPRPPQLVCVEPSARFGAGISSAHSNCTSPMHQTGLAVSSIDALASLAGLHHIAAREPIYHEWARVLRPGGRLAVADVQAQTAVAEFLNGFVHEHSPGGHRGHFVEVGEWLQQLNSCGFEQVSSQLLTVPWRFQSRVTMTHYCRDLFALHTATLAQVEQALQTIIGVSADPRDGSVLLNWQLRYGRALRR